jgi:hypothetical protein
VNYEKDSADPKEQDKEWQFEYEQESPLNETEGDVIDPEEILDPQNLNKALREDIQLVGIPETDYAMKSRICQCDDSKAQ